MNWLMVAVFFPNFLARALAAGVRKWCGVWSTAARIAWNMGKMEFYKSITDQFRAWGA